MGGVELRLRPVFGIRSGACQMVDLDCYELPEDCLGRCGRRFGGTCAGERPGRRRHQSGQLGQPVGILADEHRNPCRHGLPAPFREAGQELLTGRQRDRQLHGVGPVGQIGPNGDAGFHDLLPVPLLQQLHGLLRCQAERCHGPWPDARLCSRLGHGASHGAGRHGGVAPAGQPGDCAAEAIIAHFEPDRFGYALGFGAVWVFPIQLPVGRRQAWLGVLAPENEVSFVSGGVQDEHGVVRCRMRMTLDDRARVWQGAGGFQKRLAWNGRISSGARGGLDRFLLRGGWEFPGIRFARRSAVRRGHWEPFVPELPLLPLPSVYRATTMVSPSRRLVFGYCLPGSFREQPLLRPDR